MKVSRAVRSFVLQNSSLLFLNIHSHTSMYYVLSNSLPIVMLLKDNSYASGLQVMPVTLMFMADDLDSISLRQTADDKTRTPCVRHLTALPLRTY